MISWGRGCLFVSGGIWIDRVVRILLDPVWSKLVPTGLRKRLF